jgi:lipopolysaccharide/colanic/teichoic acid biosynthesis glycosyltransferase
VKQKLRKHRYSILFALVWGVAGFAFLSYAALNWFPFIEEYGLKKRATPLLAGASAAYLIMTMILARLRSLPYANKPFVVNFAVSVTAAILFMALAAARVYFSLGFLALYVVFTNLWFSAESFLRSRFSLYVLAVVRGGYPLEDKKYPNVKLVPIDAPAEFPEGVDGVVVDFGRELSKEWIEFVSRCVMEGVPVISSDDFIETQTGTIILDHLNTAQSINFQQATFYMIFKRIMDIVVVLLTVPLWVPLLLLTMIAVKLESPGPAIFTQQRVGMRGRPFTVYKVRSMRNDSEKHGAAFASKGDARVTRIGAFIRKFRIDELPQFVNILKGDMSLIGPRPEQVKFVQEFEKSIPYFSLRHIVRPGISGWAQVTQGYAAGTDEAAVKLSHDLYYVKRLSFIMDALIAIRTIGTILTGFGAR